MENLKSKKVKADIKKNEFLMKTREKSKRKRKKKTTKKESDDSPKCFRHLFPFTSQPGEQKTRGPLRAKGKDRVEGMFFKGLRSDYITRNSLNEANKARKNEDINKIIDLGRVFSRKKKEPKRLSEYNKIQTVNEKANESTLFFGAIDSNEVDGNLEQFSLSSIRFPCDLEEHSSKSEDLHIRRKLNLDKEFENFSLRYEERVETQLLSRLPGTGVLEDALTALINKDKTGFSRRVDLTMEEAPKPPEKSFPPETHYFYYCESLLGKPRGNGVIEADMELESCYHPSFMPPSPENVSEMRAVKRVELQEDFEKLEKNLLITTPAIQFYRRNMF